MYSLERTKEFHQALIAYGTSRHKKLQYTYMSPKNKAYVRKSAVKILVKQSECKTYAKTEYT